MQKLLIVVGILLLCAGAAGVICASGIDNKTNWSAAYARTMNRNAVYDAPDAAVYNPAGIGRMEDGLFVGASNQTIPINYSHESAAELYEAKNPTILLPSAFVVYKRNKLGFYGAFYVPAGGGRLKYKAGIVDLNEALFLSTFNPKADLFGVYYAGTVGAVYAVNDMISLSVGGRYIFAKQTTNFETEDTITAGPLTGAKLLLDTKATASGFDVIIGINIAPISGLNVGLRYETKTKLEWEYKDVEGPLAASQGIAEGDTYDRDLPALLGAGVSYMLLPQLRAEASLDIYFNTQADWDGGEDDVKTGFAFGAACEYALLSNLKASAGFLYTKTGADKDSYLHVNPALNSITLSGGALYQVTENLSAELGILKPFYTGDDGVSQIGSVPLEVDKSLWIIALGVNYKVF